MAVGFIINYIRISFVVFYTGVKRYIYLQTAAAKLDIIHIRTSSLRVCANWNWRTQPVCRPRSSDELWYQVQSNNRV